MIRKHHSHILQNNPQHREKFGYRQHARIQTGPTLIKKILLFCLVDEGRDEPNTTISWPSLARQRADDGQTLNAGLVAL